MTKTKAYRVRRQVGNTRWSSIIYAVSVIEAATKYAKRTGVSVRIQDNEPDPYEGFVVDVKDLDSGGVEEINVSVMINATPKVQPKDFPF